jgi:hypothetical protein
MNADVRVGKWKAPNSAPTHNPRSPNGACGTKQPSVWRSNGAQRRKRDRAPRLMARKPRRTDVRRPALEGENK